MSADGGNDPLTEVRAWIEHVGRPMVEDVRALKRNFWTAAGFFGGAGVVFGLIAEPILRKLGLK